MQINMDTSSASSSCSNNNFHHQNNWLAFSLSNNSHQLSLFQSSSLFNPTSSSSDGVELSEQENYNVEGPKFEDFLGGANGGSTAALDGGATVLAVNSNTVSDVPIYDDSGLKTIPVAAGGFLRGFSVEGPPEKAVVAVDPPAKKAPETFGQRTSIYRGVTRHRWTGRYEAHLWDNSCRREGQSRKGRQVYLGGYDKEDKAARAYDLAAIKYWGPTTTTNFPISNYEKEIEEMKHMTRQEFVASLRRRSSGFSRGASMYRGVTRHHQHGRWQARIGRVAGNKDLYLGTFSTQEEAAEAYDIAAIKFRGLNAVTNFDMSRYDVKSIASSNLPIGGMNNNNNKPKTSSDSNTSDNNDGNIQTLEEDNNAATRNTSTVAMRQEQSSNFWAALGYGQNPSSAIDAKDHIIMKQDHQPTPSLWAALGYSQNPNCDGGASNLFSGEFQTIVNGNGNSMNNGEAYYNNNGAGVCYYQQQQGSENNGENNSCSPGTVLTENEANKNGQEAPHGSSSAYAHWLQQQSGSHASYQSGKGNNSISGFQTPIFGIE